MDLLSDTALWIVKGFRGTTYYIVIIFQRIQYLVQSFSGGGEYVAILSFDIILHSCVILCVNNWSTGFE
jgi:hypothetical protein